MKLKKILPLLFFLIFIIIANLRNKDTVLDKDSPVELTLLTYYKEVQLERLQEMTDEFNDTVGKENGVFVKILSQGSVTEENKLLSDSANQVAGSITFPDIFIAYKGAYFNIDGKIEVMDYRKYFSEEELREFLPQLLEIGRFDESGKIYMLPIMTSTVVTYVNKTDFANISKNVEMNIDDLKTYEGLIEASEKYYNYTDSLTAKKNDGLSLYGTDSVAEQVLSMQKAMGEDILVFEDGKIKLNFGENISRKVWEVFYVPAIKGYFAKYGRHSADDMKMGKILVASGSTTRAWYYPETIVDADGKERNVEIGALESQWLSGYDPLSVQQGGGIFVTKNTRKKELASSLYVKWLTSDKNNLKLAVGSSYMPVKVIATENEKLDEALSSSNITPIVSSSIIASIKQTESRKPYIATTLDGYEDIRKVILKVLEDEVYAKRAEILKRVEDGEDYDELVEQSINEESYKIWKEAFIQRMENVLIGG